MKKILSYFFIINLVLFGLIACETSDNSTGFYSGDSLATKKTNQVEEISVEKIVKKGFDKKVVEKTAQLLAKSEYKRFQAAPGPKVTNKAFGRDRRFPLTSGFKNWN